MTRKQHLKSLEYLEDDKNKQIAYLTAQISQAIADKSGTDVLVELCHKRNILCTDVYLIGKKKSNLRDHKSFLGEEISEIRENGSTH